jgi:hypothetical protein
MLTKSNLILISAILVAVAPKMVEIGSAANLMEWGTAWNVVHVVAGVLLARLSGQHREREKNGKVERS